MKDLQLESRIKIYSAFERRLRNVERNAKFGEVRKLKHECEIVSNLLIIRYLFTLISRHLRFRKE